MCNRVTEALKQLRAFLHCGFISAILIACLSAVSVTSYAAVSSNSPNKKNDDAPWLSLSAQQRQALAPLAEEWGRFEADGKKKWLEIADKFQSMKQVEQKRVQEKMQAWVKLTPEERVVARENYIRSNKLKPDQRNEKWKEYQQLTEAQKSQLANRPAKKKLITNLPSPEESKAHQLQPLKPTRQQGSTTPVTPPQTVLNPVRPATPQATGVSTVLPADSATASGISVPVPASISAPASLTPAVQAPAAIPQPPLK